MVIPEEEMLDILVPCKHHWVIQPANGPISIGSCQICDETKEFKNSVTEQNWGSHPMSSERVEELKALRKAKDDGDIDEGNGDVDNT